MSWGLEMEDSNKISEYVGLGGRFGYVVQGITTKLEEF